MARWSLGGELVGGETPWWRDDRIPYNKIGSTATTPAQQVIEKELEWYVRMLEKSPSIVSKEDQAEHNIVTSCVNSASKKTKVHVCCKFKLALL